MSNPIQAFANGMRETFVFIIFIIALIIIFSMLGVSLGMEEFTNQIISSLGLGTILILAIPPIGLIIGIILWIKKAIG